jgi:hypothetical protein
VGAGAISPVEPAVAAYQVSGMPVLRSWFDYRKRNPAIKRSSPLDDIQLSEWTSDQTTELLKLIDVLTGLVELEPQQAEVLDAILSAPLVTVSDLEVAGVLPVPPIPGPSAPSNRGGQEELPLVASSADEVSGQPQRSATTPVRRSHRTPGRRQATPQHRGGRPR